MQYTTYEAMRMVMDTVASNVERSLNFAGAVMPMGFWESRPTGPSQALMEMFVKLSRRYERPEYGIESIDIDGTAVDVTVDVVEARPFCRLLCFKRNWNWDPLQNKSKVFVVAPMSGHFPTLLRDTITELLRHHDVYITDWEDARDVPVEDGLFNLNDYIDYTVDFIRLIGPGTHVLTISQPGSAICAMAAIMSEEKDPARPKSITLLASPIDTRVSATLPSQLGMRFPEQLLQQTCIQRVPPGFPGATREVYPGYLQLSGFAALNIDRHVVAHFRHFWDIVAGAKEQIFLHDEFYSEYLATMDMTAEFFLQSVEVVFREHSLIKGEFEHRGRRVNLGEIRDVAIMAVEAGRDDICGPGQTNAILDLTPNLPSKKKARHFEPEAGHMGVFHGSLWRTGICPAVNQFVAANA